MRRKKIRYARGGKPVFAAGILPEHNARFRRAAAEAEDYHRRAPSAAELREVFRLETERIIGNDWVVRYENRLYQVEAQSRHYAPAQGKVVVCEWEDGTMEIEYRGRKLPWKEIQRTVPRVSAELKRRRCFGSRPARTLSAPHSTRRRLPLQPHGTDHKARTELNAEPPKGIISNEVREGTF